MPNEKDLQFIGAPLPARDRDAHGLSRIATAFPAARTIVTLPGIHATQRMAFIDKLNQDRRAAARPALSDLEEMAVCASGVDLILEGPTILIRPDPEAMDLAFLADELLQEVGSKRDIRYLETTHAGVREAIKRRGECWRIVPPPSSPRQMLELLGRSRIAIRGLPIYYYNSATGTRFLTWQSFDELGALDDVALRRHLEEIQEFAGRYNIRGHTDVAFFKADGSFTPAAWAGLDFNAMDGARLRQAYVALRQQFEQAVVPEFRRDNPADVPWRNAMVATLLGKPGETVAEESLLGLSPEFFMQIEWLPGARIEEGELLFDTVLDEPCADARQRQQVAAEQAMTRGFFFNLVREYGDLCYANLGRVSQSLADRPPTGGRREVFLAQIKCLGDQSEIIQVIRMQKWGVGEYLDEGMNLEGAMLRSEEYTDYVLDRRLGCRQLGMRLPPRIIRRQIAETYRGKQARYHGRLIWSTYFERDYLRGIATTKLSAARFREGAFGVRYARLMGEAAAVNLVVGRADPGGRTLFDDGDELLREDEAGMPAEIIVADPTGAFANYLRPLEADAPAYAAPVTRWLEHVPDRSAFIAAYLGGLAERFEGMQRKYRRREQAFDTLFQQRPPDPNGNFAFRWERTLAKLDSTPSERVVAVIAGKIGG